MNETTQAWFAHFTSYLVTYDLDFAFWPLVGYLENGYGNGWALLNWHPRTRKRDGIWDGNDWRAGLWTELVSPTNVTRERKGLIEPVERWDMLNLDHSDYVQSLIMRGRADWDTGAFKAACPDGQRLIGLSHEHNRGLCTNSNSTLYVWDDKHHATQTVWDESFVDHSNDWAPWFSKFQCPENHFAIGYAVRGEKLSTLLCAKSKTPLPSTYTNETVWFDREDGGSNLGGDFAFRLSKGVCAKEQYLAGVAFSTSWMRGGRPDAILCRGPESQEGPPKKKKAQSRPLMRQVVYDSVQAIFSFFR